MTVCKGFLAVLALGCTLCQTASGDMKVKVRTSFGVGVHYRTTYVEGDWRRIEQQNHYRTVRILHCDTQRAFEVDFDRKQYSLVRWRKWPSREETEELVRKPDKRKAPEIEKRFGKEEWKTVDTGERKEVFGYTARHLIITVKRYPGTAVPSESTEVIDGWYIDLILREQCQPAYRYGMTVALPKPTPDGQTSITVKFESTVFPVKVTQTRRSKIVFRDGTSKEQTHVIATELVELSKEPLDPALFEIPPGFKKVRRLKPPQ